MLNVLNNKILGYLLVCFIMILMESCEKEQSPDIIVNTSVPIDPFLQKDGLKILDIGNSYTDDATDLLPLLVEAANVDLSGMCLYKATRGGASFKNWYDIYHDRDGASVYYVNKVIGGDTISVPTGKGLENNGELFRRLLTEVQWDIIFIHQLSSYAPYYDQWRTKNLGGYLEELLTLIREHQPSAKIGFLLVHSYSSNYSGNKEHSSFKRWSLIAQSIKRVCDEYDIEYVIPYGTAVQNLRASSLNDSYDLSRDGKHCGIGLCRYTAACCYYEALIAPRTGISVLGNSARFKAPINPKFKSSFDVTDNNALIAQKAAVLANLDKYNCTNPELFFIQLLYGQH